MIDREEYVPGPARGARVDKQGDTWTLVLVRDLSHPPAKVWTALTDPEHLREWAPFDSEPESRARGHYAAHDGRRSDADRLGV